MNTNELYIQRCLDIARNGLGNVAPNPLVGAVIVYDDKIIGEGYHQQFGQAHAEVNAINSVIDKELLKKSTIYVNLEPCSHYGKTPPCAELIIRMQIPHVVIGMIDPNEKVAGCGIKMLNEAGIRTTVGVLNEKCRELNKRFITFHTKKRPYIILKWAQTIDGFVDIIRTQEESASPTWITDTKLKVLVHKWRTEEQAILVGVNTVLFDNPTLTAREYLGKNPVRILIDPNLKAPLTANIFDKSAPTLVFNILKAKIVENIEYIKTKCDPNLLNTLLSTLYNKNVASVIIEGGSETLKYFIHQGLWDEARVFTGNKYFNDGIKSPELNATPNNTEHIGVDTLHIYINKEQAL